jgi:hypothetical protein
MATMAIVYAQIKLPQASQEIVQVQEGAVLFYFWGTATQNESSSQGSLSNFLSSDCPVSRVAMGILVVEDDQVNGEHALLPASRGHCLEGGNEAAGFVGGWACLKTNYLQRVEVAFQVHQWNG